MRNSNRTTLALALLCLVTAGCPPFRPDPAPAPQPTSTVPLPTPPAPLLSGGRLFGVTVDSVDSLPAIVESIQRRTHRTTVRIVFDANEGPDYYRAAVTQIGAVADILGQPADSTYVEALSLAEYRSRFQAYVAAFPEIKIWEIGNEVNGDWLGSGVPAKIDAAYDIVKMAGKRAVLVPYWNTAACADKNGYWLDWIRGNISAKVKAGSDYVLTSVYGMDCAGPEPTAADLAAAFQELGVIFPGALLGLGEIGAGQASKPSDREPVIRYYGAMPQLHPRDIGFGGYWFYMQDAVPYTKPMWGVLNQ